MGTADDLFSVCLAPNTVIRHAVARPKAIGPGEMNDDRVGVGDDRAVVVEHRHLAEGVEL